MYELSVALAANGCPFPLATPLSPSPDFRIWIRLFVCIANTL